MKQQLLFEITGKRCQKCGIVKDNVEFNLSSSNEDKLQKWCNACKKHHRATYVIKYVSVETKRCPRCGVEKKAEDFYEDLRQKTRLSSRCKKCTQEVTFNRRLTEAGVRARKEEGRKYWSKAENHFRAYKTRIRRTFGMSAGRFDAMLIDQGGLCAICGKEMRGKRGLHVDHCHVTGMVRGLLCNRCNQMLGQAHDRADVLRRGAAYLEKGGSS